MFVIGFPLQYILQDKIYYWGTLSTLVSITIISLLNDWYNDYRFEELEKQIKQLKDNQNVHIQQD